MSHQFKEEPTLHRKKAYLITTDDSTLNIGTNRSEIFQYFHSILSNLELFDKFLLLFYVMLQREHYYPGRKPLGLEAIEHM